MSQTASMLTSEQASELAQAWLAAWNGGDLEVILSHWAEDCVFRSPLVHKLMNEPSGCIRGKPALRAYWGRALAQSPNLHFVLDSLFVGHDSLVIAYRNQRGQSCAEWLRIGADGLAVE